MTLREIYLSVTGKIGAAWDAVWSYLLDTPIQTLGLHLLIGIGICVAIYLYSTIIQMAEKFRDDPISVRDNPFFHFGRWLRRLKEKDE